MTFERRSERPSDRPAYLGDMHWPEPGEVETWIGVNGLEQRAYQPDPGIVEEWVAILSHPVCPVRSAATIRTQGP